MAFGRTTAFFVFGIVVGSVTAFQIGRRPNFGAGKITTSETPIITNRPGIEHGAVPLTIGEIELALSSYKVWKERENRIAAIAHRFALSSDEIGATKAVSLACKMFAKAQIPESISNAAVEGLVISVLLAKHPTRADLLKILAESESYFSPCLRAIAFTCTTGSGCVEKFRELSILVKDSGTPASKKTQQLLVNIAVQSAATLDLDSLNTLLTEIGVQKIDILIEIAKAASASDMGLAIQFTSENTKGDVKMFVKVIRELGLDKDAIRALAAGFEPGSLSQFAEAYIDATVNDIETRAGLSDWINPSILSEQYRIKLATSLINLAGGNAVTWIRMLPEADRVKLMVQLNKGVPRDVSSKYWLAVASEVSGVPESEYVSALHDAAYSLTFDELQPYLSKLSPENRMKEELEFHLRKFQELNIEDAGQIITMIESQPESQRDIFYAAAAGVVVQNSIGDAIELYEKTKDLKLKASLKSSLLRSDISAAEYWRVAASEITEAELTKASLTTNAYISKLFKQDTGKALSFTIALPDSPLRDGALSVLAREWATKNPESASEWITRLPAGSSRDVALLELTKASKDEPESAFANIPAISSESQRMDAAAVVVDWWKTRDQKKITEIISSSKLSETERAFLIERLKK